VSTKRLLCVDDDPDILKQRKLLLEASGYSVVSAGSGKEGLELLAKGPQPDLVLLDYMMPEMRGTTSPGGFGRTIRTFHCL